MLLWLVSIPQLPGFPVIINKQTKGSWQSTGERKIINASFPCMTNPNIFTPCQKIIALVSDVMLWCLFWRLMLQAKYFSAVSDYQACIKQHCSTLSMSTWQADSKKRQTKTDREVQVASRARCAGTCHAPFTLHSKGNTLRQAGQEGTDGIAWLTVVQT